LAASSYYPTGFRSGQVSTARPKRCRQVYSPVAYIGPTKCGQTTWISGTSVICSSPPGGESLLAQLTVRVDLGFNTGSLANIAYIDDASRFDPFSTCPCSGDSERADLLYLRCRP
jgi:hypothetical protein